MLIPPLFPSCSRCLLRGFGKLIGSGSGDGLLLSIATENGGSHFETDRVVVAVVFLSLSSIRMDGSSSNERWRENGEHECAAVLGDGVVEGPPKCYLLRYAPPASPDFL